METGFRQNLDKAYDVVSQITLTSVC